MKVLITGAHFTPAQAVIEELLAFKSRETGVENQESRIKTQGLLADSADPLTLPLRQSTSPRLRGSSGFAGRVTLSQTTRMSAGHPPGRGNHTDDGTSGLEIVYVGRKSTREGDSTPSVESQVLPKLGVKFIAITAGRVRRYFSFGTILSLFKIPVGFIQAFLILIREKPEILVSFGGYVAVPMVFSAWLLNIPILVHEQTLVSGLANTFSNLFADKVAVSFDKEYGFSTEKLLLTGNPMRKAVLFPDETKATKEIQAIIEQAKKVKKPLLLVTGGNQGSHVINLVIEKILPELSKKYIVVHQTGDSKYQDYERLKAVREQLEAKAQYYVAKWISVEDMGVLFSKIDLAISRCGANTLLELAYHGVPTIMIPLPFVTKDEQRKNGFFFKKHGLGEVLEEKDLSGKQVLALVDQMIETDQYRNNAQDAKKVVILDAEKKLAQEILLMPYRA